MSLIPLTITADKYYPRVNEQYTVTVPSPQGGLPGNSNFKLLESSDGGTTWTVVYTYNHYVGWDASSSKSFTKTSPGTFKYQAKDYDPGNVLVAESPIITIHVGEGKALTISADDRTPAMGQAYTITLALAPDAFWHYRAKLYESSNGGETWALVHTWENIQGTNAPLTKQLSKSEAGTFLYQASDCDASDKLSAQTGILPIIVEGEAIPLLNLAADEYFPIPGEIYTFTISGIYSYRVKLFESTDGINWTEIESWTVEGSNQPLTNTMSKDKDGDYYYKAGTYDRSDNLLAESGLVTIAVKAPVIAAWITPDDIKPFIHDWDSYGFTIAQINGAIANAQARLKDRLSPYFELPSDDALPPAGLKSIVAQYAAFLLMRGKRVALTEGEEAWVKELGSEVEDMLEKVVAGELTIKGLRRHIVEGGEEPSLLHDLSDPLVLPPFKKRKPI